MLKKFITVLLFIISLSHAKAQDTSRSVTLTTELGFIVDSTENRLYSVFPYYDKNNFSSARVYIQGDTAILVKANFKDGKKDLRIISEEEIKGIYMRYKNITQQELDKEIAADNTFPSDKQQKIISRTAQYLVCALCAISKDNEKDCCKKALYKPDGG